MGGRIGVEGLLRDRRRARSTRSPANDCQAPLAHSCLHPFTNIHANLGSHGFQDGGALDVDRSDLSLAEFDFHPFTLIVWHFDHGRCAQLFAGFIDNSPNLA